MSQTDSHAIQSVQFMVTLIVALLIFDYFPREIAIAYRVLGAAVLSLALLILAVWVTRNG